MNLCRRGLGVLFALSCLPACCAAQDLYVSAAGANSVMRFDGSSGALLGNFVAPGAGGLGDPQGIAFGPDGNLYVASNTSNNVLRFNGNTGAFIDVFASTAGMNWPAEINFREGFLYVSDFTVGRVSRFDALSGAFVDHFVPSAPGADGQSWDGNGDLYVSLFGTGSVGKYNGQTGAFIQNFVTPGSGGLSGSLDNLFLPNGNLLVSSFNTGHVKHYDTSGNFLGNAISGFFGPQGLAIGPDGNLYAGDFSIGVINRYDIDTFAFLGTFATTSGTSTTNNFVFKAAPIPEPGTIWIASLLALLAIAWIARQQAAARSRRVALR